MSTRKNVVKTTSKHPTNTSTPLLSKTKTSKESSTDRKNAKKEEKATVKSKLNTRTTVIKKKTEHDEEEIKKINSVRTNPSSVRKTKDVQVVKKLTATPLSTRLSRNSRAQAPVTPPSSRVTKTQFFPSKKMYSHALNEETKSSSRILKKPSQSIIKTSTTTTILKERKTKQPTPPPLKMPEEVSSDTSSISERPRTATLRKGSIVNHNIVGPDAPKHKIQLSTPKSESPVDYEDDFDSYESDFEAYSSSGSTTNLNLSDIASEGSTSTSSSSSDSSPTKTPPKRANSASTDDEKKLDSGNFEMPDTRHKQILDNIKESIEKENSNLHQERVGSNLGSLSDEGFEDGKSLQFINFLGAQRKYQHRKSIAKKRQRGEEILSMIRLDTFSFTLFDLPPVPYEEFIKNFGKSNTVQVSNQTGEDDLDEEVQTDEITLENKWTQFPPAFPRIEGDENFWEHYKCNYLGVGGDKVIPRKVQDNENRLEKSLLNVGGLVLSLLNEKISEHSQTEKSGNNIPFSKGVVFCNIKNQDFLKNFSVCHVEFSSSAPNKFLTVHSSPKYEKITRSFICLWETFQVDYPKTIFQVFGEVSYATFGLDCPNLIFAGLVNGTISIWDVKEPEKCHKLVQDAEENSSGVLMRTPSFSTEINQGHCSKIIAIKSLAKKNSDNKDFLFDSTKTTEVCSLDQEGELVVWSVIFKDERYFDRIENHQGMAHWGSVIIAINSRVCLKGMYPEIVDFTCTDIAVSQLDSNHLYIGTCYGVILHCLSTGGRSTVKKFVPASPSQVNCLEMCPFSPQFLLTGSDNGNISFYSRLIKHPLRVFSNKDDTEGKSKIEMIQWSQNRPSIFYTKDESNNLHVWDLKATDMFPTYSIPFKEKIVAIKLSPVINNNDNGENDYKERTYMIIATEKDVYLHILNEEHGQQDVNSFQKEKKYFLRYINSFV